MVSRIEDNLSDNLRTELRVKELEIESQKALILSLKKQINAHFTVNVLGNIKRLAVQRQYESVNEMCDGLAFLIHYAHDADETIELQEEFSILQSYVSIMNIRYENRFVVRYELDEELQECRIPRMLLQPLIENAISHGFAEICEDCKIQVSAHRCLGEIKLRVQDNGAGMDPETLKQVRAQLDAAKKEHIDSGLDHVALQNIQRRLVTTFGERSSLRIDSVQGGGTDVSFHIPIG